MLMVLVPDAVWAQEVEFPDPALADALDAAIATPAGRRHLAGAVELDLSSAGIADLSGLEAARALERLDLRGNRVADLATLTALPALREVRLGGNPIRDFSPVAPLVRSGLLVSWQPATPRGPHTIRVAVDGIEVAAKTAFLLGARLRPEADAAQGYVETDVADAGLELALRTGQRVVVVAPETAPAGLPKEAASAAAPRATSVDRGGSRRHSRLRLLSHRGRDLRECAGARRHARAPGRMD